jgi:hypothetical protein
MDVGEGDGGREVPPVHLEISRKGIEGGCHHRRQGLALDGAFRPRPLSPPEAEVPFKTAKGFGNWLHHQYGDDPDAYFAIHCRFIRFTRNMKIRQLVRFGKRGFRGMERLYFLQGLHIIAPTIKQKSYIKRVFQAEREKFLLNKENAPGAITTIPSPY